MKLTQEKYEHLKQRVATAAAWVARRRPDLQANVESEVWAGIVWRAKDDEKFLSQQPSYIVQYGAWLAGNWLNDLLKDEARDGQSLDAPAGSDGNAGNVEGAPPLGELLADSRAEHSDPHETVPPRLEVERVLTALSSDRVAYALAAGSLAGYRPAEIARILDVPRVYMTRAKGRIAAVMAV